MSGTAPPANALQASLVQASSLPWHGAELASVRLAVWLAPGVSSEVAELIAGCALGKEHAAERLALGRGAVWLARTEKEGSVLVRPYVRGGWAARVTTYWYFGFRPRSLVELETLLVLAQRGVPVVEGLAAAARRVSGIGYRAWLATRYWGESETLWDWWRRGPAAAERRRVLTAVGVALARLHRAGGAHPDLNARNILVRAGEENDCVRLLDFDRARCHPHPLDPRPALRRLARSLRKLDPDARVVREEDWTALEQALWGAYEQQ